MSYTLTNARMIDSALLACDMRDANGKHAASIFLGTHYRQAEAAQSDAPSPHVLASRAFAAARALRMLSRSEGWRAFIVNGIIDPTKNVPVPVTIPRGK